MNHPVLYAALIGVGLVFAGLVFVYLLATGQKRMIAQINEKIKKHDEQILKSSRKFAAQAIDDILKAKEERDKAAKQRAQAKASAAAASDNGAVVAAITAAISVMMDGAPFKVKSVRRAQAQSANAWDIVAIQEQNNNL